MLYVDGLIEAARILDASVALLQTDGLTALSMREVARRAGVSHQAPYHHLEDREAILAAIAEDGFRRLGVDVERVVDGGLPGARKLEQCGLAYVKFARANPAHFRVMFRPELVDLVKFPSCQEQGDRSFQSLLRIVRQCVEEGLPASPSEEAITIMAWSVGHGVWCLLLDGPLANRFPESAAMPDYAVAAVMQAMRVVLEASMPRSPSKPRAAAKKKRSVATKKRATRA